MHDSAKLNNVEKFWIKIYYLKIWSTVSHAMVYSFKNFIKIHP